MNMLSLRVSSIKGSENLKKNSDVRHECAKLPLKYAVESGIYSSYIDEFKSSNSIENQIKLIKSNSSTININDNKWVQFLSDVLFDTALKHPVRQTILKIFQNIDLRSLIIDCISITISENISNIRDVDHKNQIITAFLGYFENFPPGYEAIKTCLPQVIEFLEQILFDYLAQLEDTELSPAFKNEVYLNLHYAVRVIQTVLQQFSYCIKNETVILFQKIISNYDDVPMDTKINCGSVIALSHRNNGTFKEFSKSLMFSNEILNLCLNVGFINVFDKSDDLVTIQYLIEHGKCNSNDSAIILATMRGLLQWSKKLVLLAWTNSDELEGSLEFCLDFTIMNLEHHLDSIRHLSRDILKNLAQYSELKSPKILDCIFQNRKSIISNCHCYNSLAQVVGVEKIIQHNSFIVSHLIENLSGHAIVSTTYETLMIKNFRETDFDCWYNRWMLPLLEIASDESASKLIIKSVKLSHEIAVRIDAPPQIKLTCLGTARKHGFFNTILSSETHWKNFISFKDLKNFALSNDDDLAISAFRLMAETQKSTEKFDETEFYIIFEFLNANINCQSPAMRQHILAYMKMIVLRLRAVISALDRKKDKCLKIHKTFLLNLHQLCLDNVDPSGNFSRRTIALRILIMILPDIKDNWKESHVNELIKCFEDSYDINKDLSIEVLLTIPHEIVLNSGPSLQEIELLASSIRPNDSTTAAYHLEFYVRVKKIMLPIKDNPNHVSLETRFYYSGISWCMSHLENALNFAESQGIVKASQTNPLYGYVFCLRHLINSIPWKTLTNSVEWSSLFNRLIKLLKELTSIVSPIVNNSSPEGHFPNDINDSEVTPQMLLLCAWRTVKEVSLLLGDITLHAPIEGLLKIPQIYEIGQHFTQLLAETKHRGAFEQAYVGFSNLCQRLWSSHYNELHTLPLKWLENLIGQISGDVSVESEIKLCATRRSAGVPFMVQALITSELQVCSSKGLKFCMAKLLELAKNGQNEETRTHALNILRALYRCSDLGEAIAEYIADGIETSILGYDAGTWAEQNSSTLLFSALMVRVFGVQRTKHFETLNIRNKMTGRIFFLRYPKLFDFFLHELKVASIKIKTEKYRRLHPILLLLSRLYPSSLEGSESSLKLSEALPFIIACSSCPELQTRILIAKSIVALISPNHILPHILSSIDQLKRYDQMSSNLKHSLLLHILHLIQSTPKEIHFSNNELELLVVDLNHIFKSNNLIIIASFLEVVIELILRLRKYDAHFEVSEKIKNILISNMNNIYDDCKLQLIGATDVLPFIAVLRSMLVQDSCWVSLKLSDPIEYVNSILNILILIINDANQSELMDYFEITYNEFAFVNTFLDREHLKMHHRLNLCNNRCLSNTICKIASNKDNFNLSIKALTVISSSYSLIKIFLDDSDDVFLTMKLIELTQDKMDQIKIPLYKMISTFISTKNIDTNLHILPQFILRSVLPDNHDNLREISTHILINCLNSNPELFENYEIVRAILMLLRDDDSTIRNLISNLLTKHLKPDAENSLRSFYLQKLFIKYVTKKWLAKYACGKKVTLLLLTIVYHEYTFDDADEFIEDENDFRIKVFDKNEINVFGERNQVIWEIFRTIDRDELDGIFDDGVLLVWANVNEDQLNFFKTINFNCDNVKMWIC